MSKMPQRFGKKTKRIQNPLFFSINVATDELSAAIGPQLANEWSGSRALQGIRAEDVQGPAGLQPGKVVNTNQVD